MGTTTSWSCNRCGCKRQRFSTLQIHNLPKLIDVCEKCDQDLIALAGVERVARYRKGVVV